MFEAWSGERGDYLDHHTPKALGALDDSEFVERGDYLDRHTPKALGAPGAIYPVVCGDFFDSTCSKALGPLAVAARDILASLE